MSGMRRLLIFLPLLIPFALSGCSSSTLSSLLSAPTPTPAPKPSPTAVTAAPQIVSTGYDQYAGNCPDAANEDASLINYAQSQNYNFDMQLKISPTAGCDADPTSAAYATFRRQVGDATLAMNALDTSWVYGYVAVRDTFLSSVFSQLQQQYPSLSNVTISVNYGGQLRATLTYDGRGQPVLDDLFAQ
jgi:hypothetical protein